MRFELRATVVLGLGMAIATVAAAQEKPAAPTPDEIVRRACKAAGGVEAFNKLGIVGIATKSEEVSEDGTITTKLMNNYFLAPGPIPGRFELPNNKVTAGDDGSGGWAVIRDKPDQRPATAQIVRRSLATNLFPTLLPFSLTWEGVEIQDAKAVQLKGRSAWQLTVAVPRSFFDTPQIGTTWKVFVDGATYAVVRAESPFTDLGKGVTADGMRFTWREPVKVKDVTFYKEQRLTGLDEVGEEKAHSRVDHHQFHVIPVSEAKKLFANPIPPEMRPKPPALQPPAQPGVPQNG
ncbi:MAG TPA: hypothetical protein VMT19_03560 [Thermoanaerobaculaceae bacterium]|nr:hypothetical protein [Thermoanaerobaculaceae bacterium]